MLFDIVPENFFSPLSARSKRAYWECICIIFRITNSELSFGIEKEYLTDELQYYFESDMSADISDDEIGDGVYEAASESGAHTEPHKQAGTAMSPRDKANLILRQLQRWGWIYVDTDMSYVQRVNFRDYAISVIRALNALDTSDHPEYQGYIYTIYNQVKAGDEQAGIGLLEIVKNTEALIAGYGGFCHRHYARKGGQCAFGKAGASAFYAGGRHHKSWTFNGTAKRSLRNCGEDGILFLGTADGYCKALCGSAWHRYRR